MNNFILWRSRLQTWDKSRLRLISNTKNELLTWSVPGGYRELHAEIITTLGMEEDALKENNQTKLSRVNQRWGRVLEQYFWLN